MHNMKDFQKSVLVVFYLRARHNKNGGHVISRCEKKEWNTLNTKKHNNTMIWSGADLTIWNRHGHECLRIWKLSANAHPVHQNSVKIYRGRLFLGSNLVSFNRTLVIPYDISKVCFHANFFFLSVCRKRFIKFENINISRTR